MNHTPLPWELSDHDANGQRIVRSQHIEICTCWHHSVGSIEKEMEANAAFIVQACNSHDDLVAALEYAEAAIKEAVMLSATRNGNEYSFAKTIEKISAVLKHAKESA